MILIRLYMVNNTDFNFSPGAVECISPLHTNFKRVCLLYLLAIDFGKQLLVTDRPEYKQTPTLKSI